MHTRNTTNPAKRGLLLALLTASLASTAAPVQAAALQTQVLPALTVDQTKRQSTTYYFHAEPGTLKVAVQGLKPGDKVDVEITGPSPTINFNYEDIAVDRTIEHELGAVGEYMIRLVYMPGPGQTRTPQLTLEAPGLVMPDTFMPRLVMDGIGELALVSQPTVVAPRWLSQEKQPGSIELTMVGGAYAERTLSNVNGTPESFTLDPSLYPDGHYLYWATAQSPDSANDSSLTRSFFIDNQPSYTDVAREFWSYRYIEMLSTSGQLNGRSPGVFAPHEWVTREEFAKMVASSLGIRGFLQQTNPFVDVEVGSWARPYITKLWGAELVRGETGPDGQLYFRPHRPITRAEATAMVGRALTFQPTGASVSYSDANQIPSYAQTSVQQMSVLGWLRGYPDGTFGPGRHLTRAEAAKLTAQLYYNRTF